MSRNHRSGGKFCGSHTTLIPFAAEVADIADSCTWITKISIGFIETGLKPARDQRVEISNDGSSLILFVRGTTSCQEMHLYSDELQKAMEAIARRCRDQGLHICFGKVA